MSRQYGIQPGSVDRDGRISPPASTYDASSQHDPSSQSYQHGDVSPILTRQQPARPTDYQEYANNPYAADPPFPPASQTYFPPSDGATQAYRDVDALYNPQIMSPSPGPDHGPYSQTSINSFNVPSRPSPTHRHTNSQNSLLNAYDRNLNSSPQRSQEQFLQRPTSAMAAAGAVGAGFSSGSPYFENHLPRSSYYHGDGYDDIDPNSIADDGDEGLEEPSRSRNSHLAPAAVGSAGAAAGAGGGMLSAFGSREASGGNYGPVGAELEKSEWLSKQSTGNKKLKWTVGIIILLVVLGAIAGGVAGGLLANKGGGGGGSSGSSGSAGSSNPGGGHGTHSGGLYDIDSDEVQNVMNDPRLHKVFPAMDYTPNYAQYPQCLAEGGGPVQNNVTIDVAIMSQLTPAIRLYGTDCNQTQLVLEAIKLLKMEDTMKVWLGVYLDGNSTTNDRQLSDLYDILDTYDHSQFVGVIVGNEVLFSKYMTATELGSTLQEVRSNFTSRNINLPVSTADLGDNWDATLAQSSDIVMANIHPFFAGTVAEDSAGWAYTFWTGKDTPLTTQKTAQIGDITYPTQIISEIGWPSQGGNDCGDSSRDDYGCTSKTEGAVASVDNLNTFMDGWVCGALNNGTTFFWFEAFDEPWKHKFDTAYDKWEPYWGLFDVDRNLKDGLTIPDCGGKTVDKPY